MYVNYSLHSFPCYNFYILCFYQPIVCRNFVAATMGGQLGSLGNFTAITTMYGPLFPRSCLIVVLTIPAYVLYGC
jgi:hypothetical protein